MNQKELQEHLAACRRRAELRLQQPDMSKEALEERARKGAEWEKENGPISTFCGKVLGDGK